ncbi:MAG: hypothetical protein WBA39_21895 [Rivularia sp. (in: cyanobacteria)]
MNSNQNQPREFDVVLGGKNPAPVTGVVLGGIEGVKRRLESEIVDVRIKALSDALNYGDEGLDLVIEALGDSSEEINNKVISILRKSENKGKQALLEFDPWLVFTTFDNWQHEESFSHNKLINTIDDAVYAISDIYDFNRLIHYKRAKYLEAFRFEIYYQDKNHKNTFKNFVDLLADAKEKLVSLKALFIGDNCETWNKKYKYSRINVCNIYPILKAYPNLEILHIRGKMLNEDILVSDNKILAIRNIKNKSLVKPKAIKHEYLKTLIIDADGITDKNLAELCNLNLPSLEYLEIWVSRNKLKEVNIKSLAPILSGKYCQNLAYLAIRKSNNTSQLAKAIVNSSIMNNLKILELTDGNMGSGGAMTILDSPTINNLHTLNLCGNRLQTKMIQQLSQLDCLVITASQFSDRYYSVWE